MFNFEHRLGFLLKCMPLMYARNFWYNPDILASGDDFMSGRYDIVNMVDVDEFFGRFSAKTGQENLPSGVNNDWFNLPDSANFAVEQNLVHLCESKASNPINLSFDKKFTSSLTSRATISAFGTLNLLTSS